MNPPTLAQGIQVLDFARRLISGELSDPAEISKALAELALELVDITSLIPHLTQAARARDNAFADALEAAKVSGG